MSAEKDAQLPRTNAYALLYDEIFDLVDARGFTVAGGMMVDGDCLEIRLYIQPRAKGDNGNG